MPFLKGYKYMFREGKSFKTFISLLKKEATLKKDDSREMPGLIFSEIK